MVLIKHMGGIRFCAIFSAIYSVSVIIGIYNE